MSTPLAGASVHAGGSPGTVTIRMLSDWSSFDPMVDAQTSTSFAAATPGYDKFVSIGPDGKSFVPYLATSWVEKPKSIFFKLRQDAVCTDGHKLTAVDMLNSIKRWIQVPKRSGSVQANAIGGWGPGPYHLHADNKKGTLTLSLDSPYRNLLGPFAALPVICPSGLAAAQANPNALSTGVYGSGPYELVSAAHGDSIVWKLRPEWKWGPPNTSAKTMPTQLVFKVITDQTTAANLFLTNGLDMGTVQGPDVDRLVAASSTVQFLPVPNYGIMLLRYNMLPGRRLATDDVVREAISTAVDPQAYNQAVLAGRGHLTPSVFRQDQECYDPKTEQLAPKPSITAAKAILTGAGYTFVDGKATKNGQTIKLDLLTSSALFNSGPDYMISVLTQLGIDLTVSNLPVAAWVTRSVAGDYDIQMLQNNKADFEPGPNMNVYVGPPPGNATAPSDPLVTRYYNAGLQNIGKGSCKYFALAQELLVKNHYLLPIMGVDYNQFANVRLSVPKYSTDVGGYPWYYVKAK